METSSRVKFLSAGVHGTREFYSAVESCSAVEATPRKASIN